MRRRSTFLAALVGLIVLPVPAQAAVSLNYDAQEITGSSLNDGIFGPGDTVDAKFAWTALAEWQGGNGILSRGDEAVTLSDYVQPHGAAFVGEALVNAAPYKIKLESSYQCGKRVPLTMSFAGSSGTGAYPLSVPTGVAGPLKTWIGEDYGEPIADTQTVESGIQVDDDGRVKRVEVDVSSISHLYSLRWYDIVLESPSGTRVRLFNRTGDDTNKSIQNVVFSDDAELPVNDPSITQFHNIEVQPDEKLSAFDGEVAKGEWKLFVRDVHEVGSARGGFRQLGRTVVGGGTGRSGGEIGGGEIVGQVDGWTLKTATATCSTNPLPWFGPDPLIVSPTGGTLNGAASVDPGRNDGNTGDGAITKYEWDLDGNGTFEVDRAAQSTVPYPPRLKGKYNVGLRVTDNNGHTSTVTREIIVTQLPTIGALTVNPQTPQADELATLTLAASDPDGSITEVGWDFDADGKFEVSNGALETTHKWTRSGAQFVRVRVKDDNGATAVKSFTINVANQPPVPDLKAIGAPPYLVGVPVNFTGAASVDPDGDVARYEWNFGTADTTWIDGGSTATRPFTFDASGTYDVQLRVTDNTGITATTKLTVAVTGAPTASATWSPTAPQTGQKVTFDASGSVDPDAGGGITNYEWSLDNNSAYEINGPSPTASTTFVNAGRYTVWLRVTDAAGAKVAQSFSVTVTAPPAPGGGGTPPPTTPPPGGGGGKNPDVIVKDVPGLPPTKDIPAAITPADVTNPFDIDDPIGELGDAGKTESGFAAKLAAGSKAKAKKVYAKGIAMKLTVNTASSVVAKPVISVKDAKKLGLKVKKATPIGSGKLTVTKAGTAKFVVKFSKKFQRYVKKGNKTPIVFRAVVTSKGGDAILLERKVILVK